jgi:hypothetical protein
LTPPFTDQVVDPFRSPEEITFYPLWNLLPADGMLVVPPACVIRADRCHAAMHGVVYGLVQDKDDQRRPCPVQPLPLGSPGRFAHGVILVAEGGGTKNPHFGGSRLTPGISPNKSLMLRPTEPQGPFDSVCQEWRSGFIASRR